MTKSDGLPSREPLQSSIAWATDGLLGDAFVPGHTYERQLRAASIRHDLCYGHGFATYGRSRHDCDTWIRVDALRLCSSVEDTQTLARCNLKGELPFLAVAPLGFTFYNDNLQPTCEYDPGVNPPRDFVLSGHFIRRPGFLPGQVLHIAPAANGLRLRLIGFRNEAGNAETALATVFVPLDAVAIGANWDRIPPKGRCRRAPCTLAETGLKPQDFLALAPKIADFDGDGLDDVAFIAVHGLRDPYGPQYGMIAFALSMVAPASENLVAGWVRTHDEQATELPTGHLSSNAVRQQIDVLGQTWLAGHFLETTQDQLLLFALRVEREAGERRLQGLPDRGFAEFRLLDFPPDADTAVRLGPPRLRRTVFRSDGVPFTLKNGTRLTELYRRFQNPPMLWRGSDGHVGVAALARDFLDLDGGRPSPPGVRSQSQDRGVRVIFYGPPAPPAAPPHPSGVSAGEDRDSEPGACADLASWDPDWFGCRVSGHRPRAPDFFVWNWSREVNPVMELPDGRGRYAAVSLGTDPRWPNREVMFFDTTPVLWPHQGSSAFVKRYVVLPLPDGSADREDWTVAGSWLAYPALAARLGPAGEGGIAFFRTTPSSQPAGATLEIASAVLQPDARTWRVERTVCPLPGNLAAVNQTDARPKVAEGGPMAHLRLSPIMRLTANGPRDAFAVATRSRDGDGWVSSTDVSLAVIAPDGRQGWTVGGRPCRFLPFEQAAAPIGPE